MIKQWFITGDTHGAQRLCKRLRVFKLQHKDLLPAETGIIILGDAGLNYHGETLGGSYDAKDKEAVNKYGYQLYLLRGNHEFRPSTLSNIEIGQDKNVNGMVYREEKYPNIHYFLDGGGQYWINNIKVFTIPGAYSVDKNFRLATGKKWFRDEQMTLEEQVDFLDSVKFYMELAHGKEDIIILSHTCPLIFEPHIKYLFMDGLDQDSIDKTMETFLDKIFATIPDYKYWYFGHFHDDKDFYDIKATILFEKVIPFGEYIDMEE